MSAGLIALAVTGYGAVAEALGFVLLAVGAAFSGTDLIAGIIELARFFAAVDDARSEDDLKSCGRLFGDAVAKIGVDGLFFVMSMFGLKKVSARLTTKTVADSSLNAGKWKGKKIADKVINIDEEIKPTSQRFSTWEEMKNYYKDKPVKVTEFLQENKPKGSPVVKDWFNNGGLLEITESENGIKLWNYFSKSGEHASYYIENGISKIEFPKEYLHPNNKIADFKLDSFTGDRTKDKIGALNYLSKRGFDDGIPEGYVLHHDYDNGHFQLVRMEIHKLFTHYGGVYYNK